MIVDVKHPRTGTRCESCHILAQQCKLNILLLTLSYFPNYEDHCEKVSCAHSSQLLRVCTSLSDNSDYLSVWKTAPPCCVSLRHDVWQQLYIRNSCSAAAKWKRKFSVAGGKWCCFKPSSVILESSHLSARATKLARISLVLTEMSYEWTCGCCVRQLFTQLQIEDGHVEVCSHLNHLTIWSLSVLRRLDDKVTNVLVQLPHSHGLCVETLHISLREILLF